MGPSLLFVAIHLLMAQATSHEDCIPYNPQTIRIEQAPSGWWTLENGREKMANFVTQQDAENGLALARRYSLQCFIGRHRSVRPNVTFREHRRDVIRYWKGPTGTQTMISPETCHPYVGSTLRAEDRGPSGSFVTDGKDFQIPVDSGADAKGLITLAHQYTIHCTIGATEASWTFGRFDYWK